MVVKRLLTRSQNCAGGSEDPYSGWLQEHPHRKGSCRVTHPWCAAWEGVRQLANGGFEDEGEVLRHEVLLQ
jgi:hypothetical protein